MQLEKICRGRPGDVLQLAGQQPAENTDFEITFGSLLKHTAQKTEEPEINPELERMAENVCDETGKDRGDEEEPVFHMETAGLQSLHQWLTFSGDFLQKAELSGDGAVDVEVSSEQPVTGLPTASGETGISGDTEIPGDTFVSDLQALPEANVGEETKISKRMMKEPVLSGLPGQKEQPETENRTAERNVQMMTLPEQKSEIRAQAEEPVLQDTQKLQDPGWKNETEQSSGEWQEGKTESVSTAEKGGLAFGTEHTVRSFPEPVSAQTVRLQTSEQHLGKDVAEALASRMPLKAGALELELEPAHLGKLTIRVVFESGKTAVTVMSSKPETLDILSRSVGEIAQILEERTGQQTIVYTSRSSDTGEQAWAGNQERNGDRQERRKKQENRDQSFVQQLRLGLV